LVALPQPVLLQPQLIEVLALFHILRMAPVEPYSPIPRLLHKGLIMQPDLLQIVVQQLAFGSVLPLVLFYFPLQVLLHLLEFEGLAAHESVHLLHAALVAFGVLHFAQRNGRFVLGEKSADGLYALFFDVNLVILVRDFNLLSVALQSFLLLFFQIHVLLNPKAPSLDLLFGDLLGFFGNPDFLLLLLAVVVLLVLLHPQLHLGSDFFLALLVFFVYFLLHQLDFVRVEVVALFYFFLSSFLVI